MAITVTCQCGAVLSAPEYMEGLQCRCSSCDAEIRVERSEETGPGAEASLAEAPPLPAAPPDNRDDALAALAAAAQEEAPIEVEIEIESQRPAAPARKAPKPNQPSPPAMPAIRPPSSPSPPRRTSSSPAQRTSPSPPRRTSPARTAGQLFLFVTVPIALGGVAVGMLWFLLARGSAKPERTVRNGLVATPRRAHSLTGDDPVAYARPEARAAAKATPTVRGQDSIRRDRPRATSPAPMAAPRSPRPTQAPPPTERPGRQAVRPTAQPTQAPAPAPPPSPALSRAFSRDDRPRRATVVVRTRMSRVKGGASGTGILINGNGLVITNNHVVDPNHGKNPMQRAMIVSTGPRKYQVVLTDGAGAKRELSADLLHQTESGDLALLQLEGMPSTPHYLPLAPDGLLAAGDKIRVLGFPADGSPGEKMVVTQGLITRMIRTRSRAISYVESDATVHPGNSGGPCVNGAGQLVGVATHLLFQQRKKNRSGFVPARLVKQFILNAFQQERLPKKADLLPFADIFLDQNGVLLISRYTRTVDKVVIHWRDGTVRRGVLTSEALNVSTPLGRLEVPLKKAAYLFVNGERGSLLMDGGDRLTFGVSGVSLAVRVDVQPEDVALSDVTVVSFPSRSAFVTPLAGKGVVMTADDCRLGLAQIRGKVSMGGAAFPLTGIASIVSDGPGVKTKTLRTLAGERLRGALSDEPVKASCAWSRQPIEIKLASARQATFRPVDWAFTNASGRRLTDRLDVQDDRLRQIAALLDGPDWRKASPLLEQVGKSTGGRSSDNRKQLQLFHLIDSLRSGAYEDAAKGFERLKRAKGDVGWVAKCYQRVLTRYPSGAYLGSPLSRPDTIWRASTAVAKEILADVDARLARLSKLDDKHRPKELDELEEALDIADRLEIGIAQSKLIQMLEAAFFAHFKTFQELNEESMTLYVKYQTVPPRGRSRIIHAIKKLREQIEATMAEGRRIHERLTKDAVGFVVEPPNLTPSEGESTDE